MEVAWLKSVYNIKKKYVRGRILAMARNTSLQEGMHADFPLYNSWVTIDSDNADINFNTNED